MRFGYFKRDSHFAQEEERRQRAEEQEDPKLWGGQFADVKDIRQQMRESQAEDLGPRHAKIDPRDLEEAHYQLSQALSLCNQEAYPHVEQAHRLVYGLLR